MPWVDKRKKLRKSISKAILEVEREHPNLAQTSPAKHLANTPRSSSRNLLSPSSSLAVFALSPGSSAYPAQSVSAISTPYALRTTPSLVSVHSHHSGFHAPAISPLHSRMHSPIHSRAQTPIHSPTLSPVGSPLPSPRHSPKQSPNSSPPSSPRASHSYLPLTGLASPELQASPDSTNPHPSVSH